MSDKIDYVDPEYLEKLEQRIAQLEAQLKDLELERSIQDKKLAATLPQALADAERIAELEEWNKELVQRLEQANQALTVVEQSRNDWHDKNDEQAKRIAELEDFVRRAINILEPAGYSIHVAEAKQLLEKGKK